MLRIILFIAVLALISFTVANAAEISDSTLKTGRNCIMGNISLLDITINYERNLFQWPRSYTNIRAGLGFINDLQGGGKEFSATLVHLIGKKKSHLEINLGVKCIVNNIENLNPGEQDFIPDIFAGYRFEKPGNSFVFRIGFIYPSINALTIGIGGKF